MRLPNALLAFSLFVGIAAAEAKYSVLYSFGANANDGNLPNGGLVFDKSGNLYGTTQQGGNSTACNFGCGTVFELSPGPNGVWVESVIYSFCSQANCSDGATPMAGLAIDGAGNLYGTTKGGGNAFGYGTVFKLSPPNVAGAAWSLSELWYFSGNGSGDGEYPQSRLTWDTAGNLYGTTYFGGNYAFGSVFELSPVQGGGWSEKVLYSFCQIGPPHCADGYEPVESVTFDKLGNLYGTTPQGGARFSQGTLFELTPAQDGTWTENTLYDFSDQGGGRPLSAVNFDSSGNLYTTASEGGLGDGSVFKFMPQPGGGLKKLSLLFNESQGPSTPVAGVFLDPRFSNRLYGTAENGGANGAGEIYGLTGKNLTTIYAFCAMPGCADGANPTGSLTYHGGQVYSITATGGDFNKGVVFTIKP